MILMKLPNKYWHDEPIGVEVLYKHDKCVKESHTGNLYVRRTAGGYVFCCHSCPFHGFQPRHEYGSINETLRMHSRMQSTDNLVGNDAHIRLPFDFKNEIPPKGIWWLKKYQISDNEISTLNFGYSETYQRLILPVYSSDGRLIFWQGRNLGVVDKDNPKYINLRSKVKNVFFFRLARETNSDSGGLSSIAYDDRIVPHMPCVVLVEDILSAIKCGRIVNSIAILGSYLSDYIINYIRKYKRVYIFLDYDKRASCIKYAQRITSLTGVKAIPIIDKCDPKELSMKKLRRLLEVDDKKR